MVEDTSARSRRETMSLPGIIQRKMARRCTLSSTTGFDFLDTPRLVGFACKWRVMLALSIS